MVKVFLDANVILDFLDVRDNNIFNKLILFFRENKEKIFYLTDFVFIVELDKNKKIGKLIEDKIIKYVQVNIYEEEPPKNIDLGEWSIYLAIKNKFKMENSCVLSGDKFARKFFKENNLLPCLKIVPPSVGVGGTLGILQHLQEKKLITELEKLEIINKMKRSNRRLP